MWAAFFTKSDYVAIVPEILVAIFGLAILVLDFAMFRDKRDKFWNAIFALAGVGFAGYQLIVLWNKRAGLPAYPGFEQRISVDSFSIFLQLIILAATALVILISMRYLEIEEAHLGEYYALLLFAAVGMMFLADGTDLIVVFISLEFMGLCAYVPTGVLPGSRRSH